MRTLVIVSERNEANPFFQLWTASFTARDDDRGRRRHCEERELRSNPSGTLFGPAMDCFVGACHRARVRATRWLAMTGRPGFSLQWQWRA